MARPKDEVVIPTEAELSRRVVVKCVAREEGGWRILVASESGTISWQKKADTIEEVQEALAEAAQRRDRLVENLRDLYGH